MEKLNTFFGIYFIISVLSYGVILYYWLKGRSYKDELNVEKAKNEVKEQMIEICKKTLPKSRAARMSLFNKLTGTDERHD